MADINLQNISADPDSRASEGRSTVARTGDLRWDIIELLFFAYRDFVGDADHELEAFGFGRAHHRGLHFVHRYPGLKVADLLDVLRIPKRSLGRGLKQLLDEGSLVPTPGSAFCLPPQRARRWWASSQGCRPIASIAPLATSRPKAPIRSARSCAR